jgi:signal transduction histidine kinase/ligand-binding sensor domain-containing protein/DNA-binding response OmpR family regulator
MPQGKANLKKNYPFIFILVALAFFSSIVPVFADNTYYLRSLQVEDGLSQNMVYCILQDSQGFMWFGTQDGLNRYDGQNVKVYKKDPKDPKSIGSNGLFSLIEDDDKNLWIGTTNGVYIYNPALDSFSRLETATDDGTRVEGIARYLYKDKSGVIWIAVMDQGVFRIGRDGKMKLYSLISRKGIPATNIRSLVVDSQGNVWVATYGSGLFCLNPKSGSTEQYLLSVENSAGSEDINDVYLLNEKKLIAGTVDEGAQYFDIEKKQFEPFMVKDASGQKLFVRKIMRSNDGLIWLCTETGVYIFNPRTNETTNLRHINSDPYSLSDNAVHSFYQDREDGIWIGTFFGGVNYIGKSSSNFEKYYPVLGKNSISGKSISEFCQDDKGFIWIGTEDAGLNKFNPVNKNFENGFIPAKNIHALMYRNSELWIGTFADGLYILNLKTNAIRSYKSSTKPGSLLDNNIYSIYCDYSGTTWVGTMSGLYQYKEKLNIFEHVLPDSITAQVNDIAEDGSGIIWFATLGEGLFSYDRTIDNWHHYKYLIHDQEVEGKMVSCLLIDSKQRLWIGTDGMGICRYDKGKDSFTGSLTSREGLPDDVVYRLVEDLQGNIWGSTNKGLFRLGQDSSITTYTYASGLIGDQFNYKSGFRALDGTLYFGGIKGFVSFSPDDMTPNETIPPVVINSFQIYNKEVQVGNQKNSLLKTAITHTESIRIPYNISTFSLGFAALSYSSEGGNTYAYKLEGWDKDWIYTNSNKVTYSNLHPGKYIFNVIAANSDGTWNKDGAKLRIEILPPFYRTTLAYIIYLLLAIAVAYLVYRRISDRIKKRNEEQLNDFEEQKEKELYNAKIEFFTNITHELRTPLSLIIMPLEEIMKDIKKGDPNRANLSIISDNANRMLKLVNELLDFRKVETKGLEVSFANTDIVRSMESEISRFTPSAALKGIDLQVDIPASPFYADVDEEIFTKMLSNLMSNALKHASQKIKVSLLPGSDRFKVSISNDGDTIPAKYADKIFLPFFRIDEKAQGSGIGLPFARSLAELHKGTLTLERSNTQLTTFVIELPVTQSHVFVIPSAAQETSSLVTAQSHNPAIEEEMDLHNRKSILLVEDNEEFLSFVAKQLQVDYNVLKAGNGKQALDILDNAFVDIIISDIMMPVMDGMELCKAVKEDIRYSHIPFIMLTAKTTIQSKLDGMKIGTDEYIEKPFSADFLKARIENLLESRRKIVDSYKHSPEVALDTITYSKADENFLNRVADIIDQHIEETDLDVDKLAAAMNMSRATFYRKVKSISQLTPNDFIRLIRLKKAAELLKQKEYRVNEIAFIVGFRSSSYFSKCFFKQFGVLPKDFGK